MRIRLVIQYNGRNYFGWQRLKERPETIQQTIEDVLSEALGHEVELCASGRTDAGVSAYRQVAHFDTDTTLPIHKLPYILNFRLPPDISILSAEKTSDAFHSRFDAKRKTYCYKIYTSPFGLPLSSDRLHIKHFLDIRSMRKACKYIEGSHDFTSFTKADSLKEDNVRCVYKCDVKECGGNIDIFVTGNGFLHNMVRIIAGTLVAVGEGKIKPKDIRDILRAKDRCRAFKTLPAHYLYLVDVRY